MKLTEQEYQKVMRYITMYGNTGDILENPSLSDFIEEAASSVSSSYFGDMVYKAIALVTMHNITVSVDLVKGGGAAGGTIISKSIGPVSITYAYSGDKSEFTSTRYGRMYKDLVRSCGGGISVTGVGGRYI